MPIPIIQEPIARPRCSFDTLNCRSDWCSTSLIVAMMLTMATNVTATQNVCAYPNTICEIPKKNIVANNNAPGLFTSPAIANPMIPTVAPTNRDAVKSPSPSGPTSNT